MTVTPGAEKDIIKRKQAGKTGATAGDDDLDFRTLADTSPNGIIVFQGEKTIYVNPAAANITGYSKDELIDMRFRDVMHPDYQDFVREYEFGKLSGGQAESRKELKLVRKDGEERWVNAFLSCIEYKGRPAVLVTAVDITRSKQAEEALTGSQQMLRLAIDNIPEAVFWKDRNSVYVGCNGVFAQATGLGTPENIRGKTDYDMPWSKEQADSFRENDRRIMDNDRPEYHIIERLRESGGRNAWLETNKVPLHDAKGNVTGILGTYEDITERKQAEEALNKLRANLEKSQEIAHLGSWELDLRNNSLSWSDEVYRIFGMQPREFNATYEAFLAIVHPDDRETVDAAYTSSIREGRDTYEIEHRIVRKSTGEVRFVHEKCEHFRDGYGRITRSVGMVQDITERKQAENALRESEAMLNSIFRSAPSGIGVVVDRVIVAINDNLCQMTGYSREELLGKNARLFYPSDEEYEHVGKVKYGMIAEHGLGEVETRWRRKDGTLIDILLSSSPVAPGDLSAGVTFTALDITRRKRAEEELKAAKAQAELYLDLMSHDINNMHQIALGYLELAQEMPAPGGRNEYLDKPVEVLQRSSRLIKNVRKLQKLREGVFLTREVDVSRILEDVRQEFGAVPDKTVTLNLNGCEHCYVRADELLYDVFSNLVGNAVKHTGDMASIVIDLNVIEDKGRRHCRVAVEDNGPGIPDDFKGKIFNRMLKGSEKAKGMGLGLYLVKSLVESYQGRVWVEDRITGDHMKGARFVVLLPAAQSP